MSIVMFNVEKIPMKVDDGGAAGHNVEFKLS